MISVPVMRIAQIVLPNASAYERKLQRIDHAILSGRHQVLTVDSTEELDADLAHVYGTDLPAAIFRRFPIPYVAPAAPREARFRFRQPVKPRYVLSPVAPIDPEAYVQHLPEAVEDSYFSTGSDPAGSGQAGLPVLHFVGVFDSARPGVRNMLEQTLARIQRFRTDIEFRVFDTPPTPDDLAGVEAWVDPATRESDFDGYTAEAIAAGKAVVASRTSINSQRLENGRTGFLVPCNDPNEMTHAILTALFKLEVAELKIGAARQTVGKFRPRQRLRILEKIYEAVAS